MGVVRDDAETCVSGVFFHYAAEGHLRRRGHGVGFVEDDQFEVGEGGVRRRGGGGGEDLFGAWEACQHRF